MTLVKRQLRGEERRRSVLEATLRVLAREGPRAVTHRAVAAEAGTSVRATTYYFDSRETLLREALTHYASTSMERFARIAADGVGAGRDPLDAAADMLAATVLSDLEEDRTGLIAEIELALEVARDPALEEAYASWERGLLEVLEGYARTLGSAHPQRDARIVLATLRGLEMEALVHPSKQPTRAELRGVFAALLGAIGGR